MTRRSDDANRQNDAEQGGGDGPTEIQRPTAAVACGYEQRRVVGVLVELAEPPVLRDVRPRRRPSDARVPANGDDSSQDQAVTSSS